VEKTYINESRYQAAQMVSATVENHFATHLAAARLRGEENLASEPDAQIIESIIDSAFWASLRREEGHSPKISLAFLPPEQAGQPLMLEKRLPLSPDILTKLSPGLERPGVHLGVWHDKDEIYVWGTTLKIPNLCFVLDVSEPALLVIKHKRTNGFGKFTNVAVLIGDQIKVVDEYNATTPECPDLLRSLVGFTKSGWNDSVNVLVQLAVSMRAHKRGGTLLVVPEAKEEWRSSIIHPLKYSITPAYSGLADLMRMQTGERTKSQWQTALRTELESLAGLTAIDGATVISDNYSLLSFGAKIGRKDGNARVEQILFHEPIVGNEPMIINPAQSGGTRHLSAAQFVYDQRDALALVASQDGHFTIFTWLPGKEMVQAYRIDTLLL
jgi:DNA integrity scanning protein DisA with diadenylate cyclase activity